MEAGRERWLVLRIYACANDKGTRASAVALIVVAYSSRSVRSLSRRYGRALPLWPLASFFTFATPSFSTSYPAPLHRLLFSGSSLNTSMGLSHPRDTHFGITFEPSGNVCLLSGIVGRRFAFHQFRKNILWTATPSRVRRFGNVVLRIIYIDQRCAQFSSPKSRTNVARSPRGCFDPWEEFHANLPLKNLPTMPDFNIELERVRVPCYLGSLSQV